MAKSNNNQQRGVESSPSMIDDDSPEVRSTAVDLGDPDQTSPPAKDTDGVPYCRLHHCRMKYSSGGKESSATAYYTCPVAGCKCKGQKIKTTREGVVPAQPLPCSRCSKPGKPVICERDTKVSTAAFVVLKCPACGWKSNALAVPQLAAAYFAGKDSGRKATPPVEEIGKR